ncbi:MAG: CdaR family protein, partial [Candidatus Aminicenantia bacterium]
LNVNFTNLPKNTVVVSTSTESVEVYLKVPKKFESELKKANPEINLNLLKSKIGQVIIPLNSESISHIPKGIEIAKIVPSNLVVTLDRLIEKVANIEPLLYGKEEKENVEVSPKKVKILCPSTLIALTKSIPTEPVDFFRLRKEGELTVSLLAPDPRITIFDVKEVKVRLLRSE